MKDDIMKSSADANYTHAFVEYDPETESFRTVVRDVREVYVDYITKGLDRMFSPDKYDLDNLYD